MVHDAMTSVAQAYGKSYAPCGICTASSIWMMQLRYRTGLLLCLAIAGASRKADAHCGPGSFNVTSSERYLCGTDADGTQHWGSKEFCYVQFCDEDAIPNYRNPCYFHTSCPGQPPPPMGGLCNVPSCQATECKQVCDETCGNGLDDDGDGRVDEGCTCNGTEGGCCEGQMGHPVALESGGVSTDPIEDFSLPTPGLAVSVERTWVSTSEGNFIAERAAFGNRWHTNLEEHLTIGTPIIWYRPDGRAVRVSPQSGGSVEGFSVRLVASADGYRLVNTDGVATHFDLTGRLRKRLRNGHGLGWVVYSDEVARSDCPSAGSLKICQIQDSRGTEINLSWTEDLVSAITVAPGTENSWSVQYTYKTLSSHTDPPSLIRQKVLTNVTSPLRALSYTYNDLDSNLRDFLTAVTLLPGNGAPLIPLENHEWYGGPFPPSIRGRARVSIGKDSALGFRWGTCEGATCTVGTRGVFNDTFLPTGRRETAVWDLRSSDRDAGTSCSADSGCPSGSACAFVGSVAPGGRCRLLADADVITLQDGRPISRTAGCATCNGEPLLTWNPVDGTKKATRSENSRNTTYQYDTNSRVTRTIENDTDADPTTVPNDLTYRLSDVTYDPTTGRVAQVKETSNLLRTGSRTRAFTYNAAGLLSAVSITGYTRKEANLFTPTLTTRTTTFEYQNGLLARVDGPRSDISDVLTIEYYASDVLHSSDRLRLSKMCRETGNPARPTLCTQFSDYDVWGNSRQIVDPDGVTAAITYDSSGRVVTLIRDTTAPAASVVITYDAAGNVHSYQDESGRCRRYSYGAYGSLAQVTWTASCDPASETFREDVLASDLAGRTIETTTTASGQVVSHLQFKYDRRGRTERVIKASLPGSPFQLLTRTALGFVSKSEDTDCWPVRLPTCFSETYEWLGQDDNLSAIADAGSGGALTQFTYDRDGQPKLITTAGGVWSSYEYDDFGKLTATASSEMTQGLLQVYNDGGQLIAQFDDYWATSLQRITRDPLGRPTRILHGAPTTCSAANGGTLLAERRYFYDVAPPGSKCPSCSNLSGRPARVEVDQQCDTASSTGRMTLITDYGYNKTGQTTNIVEHATSGFPAEFGSFSTPLATVYGYRPDGQLSQIAFPDGDVFTYTFDSAGRSTAISQTDNQAQEALVSDAQYREPASGLLAGWTSHVTLGELP